MSSLTVTKEAFQAITAHSNNPFKKDSFVVLPNGDYKFEVDDEIYEKLLEHPFEGESISDTLIRMFAAMDGKTRN